MTYNYQVTIKDIMQDQPNERGMSGRNVVRVMEFLSPVAIEWYPLGAQSPLVGNHWLEGHSGETLMCPIGKNNMGFFLNTMEMIMKSYKAVIIISAIKLQILCHGHQEKAGKKFLSLISIVDGFFLILLILLCNDC